MRRTPRRRGPAVRKWFRHDADLGGFVVTLEGRFDECSAGAVEVAVTDAARRGQWLPPPVHTGAAVEPGAPRRCPGDGGGWAYRMEFGDDELRLRYAGGALAVDHVFGGYEPWRDGLAAGRCAAGWETSLGRLARLLEGGSPRAGRLPVGRAMADTRWFDLHMGTPRLTVDGNLLRFDRDLLGLRPARMWALLSSGGEPTAAAAAAGLTADVVTELACGSVLEFDVRHGIRPAGSVRWELHDDPGYGDWMRMDHLVAEDSVDELYMMLAAWQLSIEALLRRAHGLSLGTLDPGDEYAIEMLAERYADEHPDLFPEFYDDY